MTVRILLVLLADSVYAALQKLCLYLYLVILVCIETEPIIDKRL